MNITRLSADLAVISKLSDNPTETAPVLKAKFDQAAVEIGEYLNNTLAPELEGAIDGVLDAVEGLKVPEIVNSLTSTRTDAALSANQGYALKALIDGRQKTISSGTAVPSGGSDGDLYILY